MQFLRKSGSMLSSRPRKYQTTGILYGTRPYHPTLRTANICEMHRVVVIMFLCVDEVLALTRNDHCEMKMASLYKVSADDTSRVICAFLNSIQATRQCVSGI